MSHDPVSLLNLNEKEPEIVANRKVILLRYCKTENGWRRYPVVIGKTGKVKPNAVLVNGQEGIYPDGYYCIRHYMGDKPVYQNVGTDPSQALQAQQREEALLLARHSADEAGTSIVEPKTRRSLRDRAADFLHEKELEPHRSRDTMDGYRIILDEFLRVCSAEFPDQIIALDILRYCAGIEKRGLSPRTRANRFGSLCTFLRYCNVPINDILTKETRKKLGRFPKTEATAYTQKEIDRLLAVCDDYYRLVFGFLLQTGFRMQEAMHLTWADVSFPDLTVSVTRKPGFFEPKDYEERTVPLLADLAQELLTWRGKRRKTKLVFGTRRDRPNGHWLEYLKQLARAAELNCGSCDGCTRQEPECELYYIHKFRATYATRLLRNGVDVRTVQKLLGHSNLDSTIRYLQPAKGKAMQERVSAALAAAASAE
jgi:integrase